MDLKNYLANGLHIQIKLGQTSALHISILEKKTTQATCLLIGSTAVSQLLPEYVHVNS